MLWVDSSGGFSASRLHTTLTREGASEQVYMYVSFYAAEWCSCTSLLMRDEKEGRKKQARSNKRQGKATCKSCIVCRPYQACWNGSRSTVYSICLTFSACWRACRNVFQTRLTGCIPTFTCSWWTRSRPSYHHCSEVMEVKATPSSHT